MSGAGQFGGGGGEAAGMGGSPMDALSVRLGAIEGWLRDLHADGTRRSDQLAGIEAAVRDLHTAHGAHSDQLAGFAAQLERLIGVCTPLSLAQLSSTSNALESSRVVAAGQSRLWGFSGTNTLTSAQFIQAHDAVTVPAAGAVPKFVMTAQASSDFWVSWTPDFRKFERGIVLCNSTTAATLTIGAANCWFDAQYTPFP